MCSSVIKQEDTEIKPWDCNIEEMEWRVRSTELAHH